MTTKKIVLLSMLSTTLVVSQMALSFLPNVELVTLLLFIYTRQFGVSWGVGSALIFSTLMGIIWGFGPWIILYYFVWTLYVLIMHFLMPYMKNKDRIAFFLGFLGLIFGLLFSLEALFYQSIELAFIYFIRGIPYDIVHAISNYIIVLLLFEPINKVIAMQSKKYFGNITPYE